MTRLPSFTGATGWLNSRPLTPADLRDRIVLVNFWTYTCINWLRTLPYLRAWWAKYHDQGVEIVGVHTPEFSFEHDPDNVRQAAADMGLTWPVALDNDYVIWNAFANHYWPALYIADGSGQIRHHWFGEGGYEESERAVRLLLREAGRRASEEPVSITAEGLEVAADYDNVESYENYLGHQRSSGFASNEAIALQRVQRYRAPSRLRPNQWALDGDWTITNEASVLDRAGGRLADEFHARDLNLVMGPVHKGSAVPFRVRLDGRPPGEAHGVDINSDGHGTATEQRTYQLIRQPGQITDRRFEIEFLRPGVEALAFTFG